MLLPLQALLLVLLGIGLDWGSAGWLTAVAAAAVLDAVVVRLWRRSGATRIGPADLITLTRATLICGVLALAVAAFLGAPPRALLLSSLSGVALVLDLVDGWVARGTGTESAVGARLDGEVDAFLMLVLSLWVAATLGWWVLVIGLARYAFGLGAMVCAWLRGQLPYRYWRKVVTASASTALVVAAARVLPSPAVELVLLAALLLVLESFGRDVLWLWRRR